MPPNCVSRLGREVQTAVHRLLVYGTAINQEKKMAPNIQQQPFVTEHSKYTRLLRKRVRVCITTVHENSSRRGKIASGGILSSFSLFRVFFFFWHFRSTFILRRKLQTLAYWTRLVTPVMTPASRIGAPAVQAFFGCVQAAIRSNRSKLFSG